MLQRWVVSLNFCDEILAEEYLKTARLKTSLSLIQDIAGLIPGEVFQAPHQG